MVDAKLEDLKSILEFIYSGEVVVNKSRLPALLRAAEWLQIKGFSADSGTVASPSHNQVDVCHRCETIEEDADPLVKLNVGGSLFTTKISTLTRQEGMLRTMFNSDLKPKKDKDGYIFIDRSGKHFEVILAHLRDNEALLPEGKDLLREILADAKFFCLDTLATMCSEKLNAKPKRKPTVMITNVGKEYEIHDDILLVFDRLQKSFGDQIDLIYSPGVEYRPRLKIWSEQGNVISNSYCPMSEIVDEIVQFINS